MTPATAGARLGLIPLWAPDFGWLLSACVSASIALAATGLTCGLLRLRRSPPGPPPGVPRLR